MFQSYSNLKQIINSANQSQICNGPTRWGSVASMWGMSWRNNGRTGYGLLSDIDRTKFNGGASISRETQTLTIGTFLSAIISNDELKKCVNLGMKFFKSFWLHSFCRGFPSYTKPDICSASYNIIWRQICSTKQRYKTEENETKSVYLTYKSQFSSSLF